MLYLIPVPIGNLADITLRAITQLKAVEKILAEDTRMTGKLLQHLEISKPMESFHAHNEHGKLESVLEELKSGRDIALVSDAGTPGISDPGFLLVRAATEAGIPLSCLPGPTAFVPALVMSGLPCDKFYFEGFLPHKKGRMTRLTFLLELPCTFVLYESPHRIKKLLSQIVEAGGASRQVCISREISKMYEENLRGTTEELVQSLESRNQLKGEFVICVEGKL